MRLYIKKLISNKFIRNIVILTGGTAAAQIITFCLSPLITRLYGPDEFGVLGTFMAMVSILGPVAALTYPIAIVLPKEISEAKGIIKLSLIICTALGLISGIIIFSGSEFIIEIFNLYALKPFLFLIPIIIILSGLLQTIEQWLIRTKQFKISAKTAILQSFLVNSSKIGLGFVHPFASSLVIIQTLGIALRGGLMLYLSDSSLVKKEISSKSIGLVQIAKTYKDFPLYRTPQVLFNAISQGLPVILLTSFFGPAVAGFYSIAKQALATPVQLVGKAVQDVFYPRISEAVNNNDKISRLIIKSILGLSLLGVIPFGTITFFGPQIFSFVFGSEWVTAGIYAQWISLMSFFMLITRPIVVTIPVLNIQKQFLLYEIVGSIVKLGALLFAFIYFKKAIYAVALFAISNIILYTVLSLYTILKAKAFDSRSELK